MHIIRGNYHISDDPDDVDIASLKHMLSASYWAADRSIDVIKKTIENSICFSVHTGNEQVAFARVVTDYATFGYIADVIVVGDHKGNGIGKWLLDIVVNDVRLKGKLLMLATDDAHTLYEKYGFQRNDKLMSTLI